MADLACAYSPRSEPYLAQLLQQQPAIGVRLLSLAAAGMAKAAADTAKTAAKGGQPRDAEDWLIVAQAALEADVIGWGGATRLAFAPALMRSWLAAAAAAGGDAALAAEAQQLQRECQAAIRALAQLLHPGAADAAGAAAPCQPSLPSFAGSLAALLCGSDLRALWAWQLSGTLCDAANHYSTACLTIDFIAATRGSQPIGSYKLFSGAVAWAQEQLALAGGMIAARLPALIEQDPSSAAFRAAERALGSFCGAVTAVGRQLDDRSSLIATDGTGAASLLAVVCAVIEAAARGLAACWQQPAPAGWAGRQQTVEGRICRLPCDAHDSRLPPMAKAIPLLHGVVDRCLARAHAGLAGEQQAMQQELRKQLLHRTLLSLRSVCKLAHVSAATAASPQHSPLALALRLECTGECMLHLACAVGKWQQRSDGASPDPLRCAPGFGGCAPACASDSCEHAACRLWARSLPQWLHCALPTMAPDVMQHRLCLAVKR